MPGLTMNHLPTIRLDKLMRGNSWDCTVLLIIKKDQFHEGDNSR